MKCTKNSWHMRCAKTNLGGIISVASWSYSRIGLFVTHRCKEVAPTRKKWELVTSLPVSYSSVKWAGWAGNR